MEKMEKMETTEKIEKPITDRKSYESVMSDSDSEEFLLNIHLQNEENLGLPHIFSKCWNSRRSYLVASIIAFACLIGMGTILLAKTTSHPQHAVSANGVRVAANGLAIECGDTPEEAIANGCFFDNYAYYYIPPACVDLDLRNEAPEAFSYLSPNGDGIFPYWRWPNLTEPVPHIPEEQLKYERLWTLDNFHKLHCSYMMRLGSRATLRALKGEKEVYVLSAAIRYEHIVHCQEEILNVYGEPPEGTIAYRAIGRCVRVDEYVEGDLDLPHRLEF